MQDEEDRFIWEGKELVSQLSGRRYRVEAGNVVSWSLEGDDDCDLARELQAERIAKRDAGQEC